MCNSTLFGVGIKKTILYFYGGSRVVVMKKVKLIFTVLCFLPFGFTLGDFFDSHDKQVATHAPYGLKPFVQTRIEYAKQQIPGFQTRSTVLAGDWFFIYPNPSDGQFIYINYTQPANTAELTIYNTSGQPVDFNLSSSHQKTTVSFPGQLTPGIYLAVYGTKCEKFVIK